MKRGPKPTTLTPLERLLKDCHYKESTGCWLWTGSKTGGYGRVNYHCIKKFTHIFMYEICKGPVPEGKILDHWILNDNLTACDKACMNPDHLEPVTPKENYHRSQRAKNNSIKMGNLIGRLIGLGKKRCSLPEGVYKSKNKLRARIALAPGVRVHLGMFHCPIKASKVYSLAKHFRDTGRSNLLVGIKL